MAKKQKQVPAAVVAEQSPVVETKPTRVKRLRLPLGEARTHNGQFNPIAKGDEAVSANIALTSKGTNPKKVRVYGYDNLANGGGVPKASVVAVVEGVACPKGVNAGQFDRMVELAKSGDATVQSLYDNGIRSRTVRRAYRAGAIRFAA